MKRTTAILCSAAMLAVPRGIHHIQQHHHRWSPIAHVQQMYESAQNQAVAERIKQTECVAAAVYFEARGEPERTQAMVADVVLNRTNDPKFPDTPCAVVRERRDNVCQFSWRCKRHVVSDWAAWDKSIIVARAAMIRDRDKTHGATYFRTRKVRFRHMRDKLRVTAESSQLVFLASR